MHTMQLLPKVEIFVWAANLSCLVMSLIWNMIKTCKNCHVGPIPTSGNKCSSIFHPALLWPWLPPHWETWHVRTSRCRRKPRGTQHRAQCQSRQSRQSDKKRQMEPFGPFLEATTFEKTKILSFQSHDFRPSWKTNPRLPDQFHF